MTSLPHILIDSMDIPWPVFIVAGVVVFMLLLRGILGATARPPAPLPKRTSAVIPPALLAGIRTGRPVVMPMRPILRPPVIPIAPPPLRAGPKVPSISRRAAPLARPVVPAVSRTAPLLDELRSRQTLRDAIILTELLEAPPALRNRVI